MESILHHRRNTGEKVHHRKKDWNNDKPVLYVEGEVVAGKPRGNSITGKRARKMVKYCDDGQEEEEEETNQYDQDSTEDDVQTGKSTVKAQTDRPAKKQKVKNTGMQKATKEETIQKKKDLQQIIKKRMIEYIPKNLMVPLQTEAMCKHMVNDITTYYNKGQQHKSFKSFRKITYKTPVSRSDWI
jgi:hypothetical protein